MKRPPLLIVVTGPPGAGKTTLALRLADGLGLPLVAKDDIKETLFDALGTGDREWSRRLGDATYALQAQVLRRLLGAGVSVIAEANFTRGPAELTLRSLPPHRVAQLHCSAPSEVLLARYASRADRHPGHLDDLRLAELESRLATEAHGPLDLDGELIELDTSDPVELEPLLGRLRALAH